jgi:hypothetical protein
MRTRGDSESEARQDAQNFVQELIRMLSKGTKVIHKTFVGNILVPVYVMESSNIGSNPHKTLAALQANFDAVLGTAEAFFVNDLSRFLSETGNGGRPWKLIPAAEGHRHPMTPEQPGKPGRLDKISLSARYPEDLGHILYALGNAGAPVAAPTARSIRPQAHN